MACLSSYDARVYVAWLGAWGVLPGKPTLVHVRYAPGRSFVCILHVRKGDVHQR